MITGLVISQYLDNCPSAWVLTTCYQCKGNYNNCGNNAQFPSMSNADCRSLINGGTVVSVHYSTTGCARYNCFHNTYYATDRWQAWATCNNDCTNFTLTQISSYDVVSSASVAFELTVTKDECFVRCFNEPQCYTFTWNGVTNVCKLYTSCGTSCATVYNSDVETYVRSCHGRKYVYIAIFKPTVSLEKAFL